MVLALTMDEVPQPTDPDLALMRRWREAGDREALGLLLARHAEDCWRLAFRLCGAPADADDAMQQAMLQAMRHAGRHRGGSVRAWLLAIVANATRDLMRRSRVRARHERIAPAPPPAPPPEEDMASRVRAALARLPESYSAPVILAYVEGMPSDAIASALGISATAVRKRCERALARLRADPELAGAIILPQAMAALPAPPAPQACRQAAIQVAKSWSTGLSTSVAVIACVAATLAGACVLAATWPAAPRPPLAVAEDRPTPPSAPGLDRDAALLDSRVTLSLRHASLDEALTELDLALPRGQAIARSPDMILGMPAVSRSYANAPVRRVLDDFATDNWAWHVSHGYLTFYQSQRTDLAGSPDSASMSLGALRGLLLQWGRAGNEKTLRQVFLGLDNFWADYEPIAALDGDREAREAVRARIERMDAAREAVPPRAIEIAGALHLTELAPSFLTQLAACPAFTPGDSAQAGTPEWRRIMDTAVRRYCLIIALGEIGGKRAIPALEAIAIADGVWRIGHANCFGDSISPFPSDDRTGQGYQLSWFCLHREAAIAALARLGGPGAIAALRLVTEDRSAYAPRWLAERELARLGDAASLPALRLAWRRKRTEAPTEHWDNGDPEPAVLCAAIGRLGDPLEVIGMLEDPATRQPALEALCGLRDPRIAPAVLALLRRDRDLAQAATKAGNRMVFASVARAIWEQPGSASLLLSALGEPGDSDAAWRRVARFALAGTRESAAVPWLATRATDGTLPAAQRAEAVAALGWTDCAEEVAPLAAILGGDADAGVRRAAVAALQVAASRLRSTSMLDGAEPSPWGHMAKALAQDRDPTVRAEVVRWSGNCGVDELWISAWIAALQTERDPQVLGMLISSLEQARWQGVSKHDLHRCLAALALAPDVARPEAQQAVARWLQSPDEGGFAPSEFQVAFHNTLAARHADGVTGVEETARALDALLAAPKPARRSF